MKKYIVVAFVATLFFVFISGCTQLGTFDRSSDIPNAAIDFCTEQGLDYELRGDAQGNPVAYCLLDENVECEVWDYYEGKCPV